MIFNNAQGGENLQINVSKSLAVIEWNKDMVVSWANQYAEQYKDVQFDDEKVEKAKEVCADLSSKVKRLDEIRLEQGRAFKAPLDKFYADIKEVQSVLNSVRDPLWEQVKKYEKNEREKRSVLVKQWVDEVTASVGLRSEFSSMIDVAESWTIKSITKTKVKSEIEAKATTLMAMQSAADQAEEMKRQKNEMAEMMCRLQSEAAGLAVPIQPKDIYGMNNLTLSDLPAAITASVKKQQDAEQAAVIRARQQQEEAAAREAKRIADEEAARIKKVQQEEAAAAIAAVEAGKEYKPKEKQFKLEISVFGTEFECEQFLKIVDSNGYRYSLGKMEEV